MRESLRRYRRILARAVTALFCASAALWVTCVLVSATYDDGRFYIVSTAGGIFLGTSHPARRPPLRRFTLRLGLADGVSLEGPFWHMYPDGHIICVVPFFWSTIALGAARFLPSQISRLRRRRQPVEHDGTP